MGFIRYVFSFLYIRNWHTGRYELSRYRLYWFLATILLLVIALSLIALLQSPVRVQQVL